jgi:hypothetical protein
MALQKDITTEYGVTASYWRIIKRNEDFAENSVICVLGGYTSKEDREAGKKYIDIRKFYFDNPEKERADLYPLIKESKMIPTTDEEGNEVVDENGDPVLVESNEFADALDV